MTPWRDIAVTVVPTPVTSAATLPRVTTPRRMSPRVGIALAAVAVLVFLVQIVALALGRLDIALACAGVYVIAWFVMRSWSRGARGR